jgi:hypothetical protein
MMPYDTYRLYQLERTKSPREIQRADRQAAQFASALSGPFRAIARALWAVRKPYPASRSRGASAWGRAGRLPHHDGRDTGGLLRRAGRRLGGRRVSPVPGRTPRPAGGRHPVAALRLVPCQPAPQRAGWPLSCSPAARVPLVRAPARRARRPAV